MGKFINYLTNMVLNKVFGVPPPVSPDTGEVDWTKTPPDVGYAWASEIWNYATARYLGESSTDPATGVVTVDGTVVSSPSIGDMVSYVDENSSEKRFIYIERTEDHQKEWHESKVNGKSGMDWIDTHMCPYSQWGSSERRDKGQFCRFACTEESIEHVAVAIYDKYVEPEPETEGEDTGDGTVEYSKTAISSDIYVMLIDKLYSFLSSKINFHGVW